MYATGQKRRWRVGMLGSMEANLGGIERSAAGDACPGHGHARSLYSGSSERGNAIVKAVLLSPIPVQYPPLHPDSAELSKAGWRSVPLSKSTMQNPDRQRRHSQKPSRCLLSGRRRLTGPVPWKDFECISAKEHLLSIRRPREI